MSAPESWAAQTSRVVLDNSAPHPCPLPAGEGVGFLPLPGGEGWGEGFNARFRLQDKTYENHSSQLNFASCRTRRRTADKSAWHARPQGGVAARRAITRMAAIFAACLFVLPPAQARVFQLFGGGGRDALLQPGEAGWSRAYAAELSINGGAAEIEIWGTARSVREVWDALQARVERAGGAAWFGGGHAGGWGIACVDGRVLRFLVTPAEGRYAHVFLVNQSFADWRATLAAPRHQLAAVPPHPGSTPGLYVADRTSGLELQAASVAATPDDVLDFYRLRLTEDGWTAHTAGAGLVALTRGRALLLVRVESTGQPADTRLMLAHQRGPRGLTE